MARPPYPLPIVMDAVLEVIVQGSMSDGGGGVKKAFNVFHYRNTTPVVLFSKVSFKTAFQTAVIAPLLAITSSRYAPNSVKIRNCQDVSDPGMVLTIAGIGAIATDSYATDDAVVIQLNSAYRGKMCKGNKHFAGLVEADTTHDLLNTTGTTNWNTVKTGMASVLTDADGNVWTPFVLSPSWSSLKAPVKIFGVNVSSCRLLRTIGTMRKRRSATVYG